jgi:hypothetical protein
VCHFSLATTTSLCISCTNPFIDRGIRVPAEDAEESGLAVDQVRIKDKYGGGFPAEVEGFRRLRCLVRIPYVLISSLTWKKNFRTSFDNRSTTTIVIIIAEERVYSVTTATSYDAKFVSSKFRFTNTTQITVANLFLSLQHTVSILFGNSSCALSTPAWSARSGSTRKTQSPM